MFKKILPVIGMIITSVVLVLYTSVYKENREIEKDNERRLAERKENSAGTFDIWYSYEKYTPYLQYVADIFEKETGRKVNISYVEEVDYINYINSKTLDGCGPDLYIAGSDSIENIYLSGMAMENTDYSTYNEIHYPKTTIDAMTYKDKLVGYPLGFDVTALLINRNAVPNLTVPATFEDIKKFSEGFGNMEKNTEISKILTWDISNIMLNYGFVADYANICGECGDDETQFQFDRDNIFKAAEKYKAIGEYFSIDRVDGSYESDIKDFADGKIIFTLAGTDILTNKDYENLYYEIEKLPDLTEDITTTAMSYTDMIFVNPFSDQKEFAKKFAGYVSYDYAGDMFEKCGIISTRKDIHYDNGKILTFLNLYEDSISLPKLMTTEDFWMRMRRALIDIWEGNDINETFDNLYQIYKARLKI